MVVFASGAVRVNGAKAFLSKSGILSGSQPHTPFLALVPNGNKVAVIRYDNAKTLAYTGLHDSVQVIAQWHGKMRSEFYVFTLRDVREALELAKQEKAAKASSSAKHVVLIGK